VAGEGKDVQIIDPPSIPGVTHRYVRARGLRVHVAEAGEGPPLVLQHWYCGRKVIPTLAESFHVICPDMRGFGWTDAPSSGYGKENLAEDLLAVCDALGLARFALAAHDWGGFVAFIVAIRAPERVERLVLLNTGHGFLKTDVRMLRTQFGFWYMPIVGTPGLGPALMRRGVPWDAEAWETYLGRLRERSRARATQRLYGRFVAWEFAQILLRRWKRERLTVPTLLLHGDADGAIRPDFLRGYEGYTDDFRLELLNGVGHFLQEAEPERVAQRVVAFLQIA
jgi:pimeloyl-ACP methyl ester carboxylesterase